MFLKPSSRIGVHLNTTHIAWVQICSINEQTIKIQNYGLIDITLQKLECVHTSFPAEILKPLVIKHALQKGKVGVALSDALVQKATVTLQSHTSRVQLRRQIEEKAVSLFNQPLKNIYFRHHLLGFAKNNPLDLDFLIVAVEKTTIAKQLASLRNCHLTPQVIDVTSFAKARGQEILQTHQINFEPTLDVSIFFSQTALFDICLGLANHPHLKKLW